MAAENPESIKGTDAAWQCLQDAYDLQMHVAPDAIGRRVDDIDCAKDFLQHGMKGFVLKSHYVPTGERAQVVSKAVPGIKAMGAITLNHSVGGWNPVAVELAGRSQCKIVWFPTVDAENETAGRSTSTEKLPFWAKIQRELEAEGISPPKLTLVDGQGNVVDAARRCMERIRKHNMILATGHVGRKEIFAIVKEAKRMGLKKVLVTHAEFPSQSLTGDEQKALVDEGALIEHCFTTTYTNKAPWEAAFANIRKSTVARTVVSTGLRQTDDRPVAEGFAMFVQKLLDAGFTSDEVRTMAV